MGMVGRKSVECNSQQTRHIRGQLSTQRDSPAGHEQTLSQNYKTGSTSGLSRWCWTRLCRKENHFLRVVSVYRPCKTDGHLTMYQQQVRWLLKQGKNACPRQQILDDLKVQVETWQSKGDTVIILANINEDIKEELISTMFQQLGLSKVIIAQHRTHGPNIHNCSQKPIDGIFLPNHCIQTVQSGYFAFGEGIPSDHCAVWIDLLLAALGWFTTP